MASETVFYFGHHKCATRYLISICEQICSRLGLNGKEFHNAGMFNNDLPAELKANPVDFVYYSNAKIETVKQLVSVFKGFHVVRDPRDIIVSAYFSHKNSHGTRDWPELVKIRERLSELSLSDGLMYEFEVLAGTVTDIAEWDYNQSNILELKYEVLIQDPYQILLDVFQHLGLAKEIHADSTKQILHLLRSNIRNRFLGNQVRDFLYFSELMQVIQDNSFSKKSEGRKRGEENVAHHYRKGVAGDWRNYFEDRHIDFFKERYNDCLIKLGYEEDEDWH